MKQCLTEYDLPTTLRLHKVRRDRKLREYITETINAEFKRGHTYFEFTNEAENILEGTEVLLQDDKEEWFRLIQPKEDDTGDVKVYGVGITPTSFGKDCTVFIQSFGSGARHLPRGSKILYNHDDQVIISIKGL